MGSVLEGTVRAAGVLKRVRYTHDAMIDLILERPEVSQGELARVFGFTEAWISTIVNSDAFRERLAARKDEIVDPRIKASLEERLKGLVSLSLDIIGEKLAQSRSFDAAMQVATLTTKALGFGARPQGGTTINQQFVVALPQKAVDEKTWAADARANAIDTTIKATRSE